jgi:hypothetical protein
VLFEISPEEPVADHAAVARPGLTLEILEGPDRARGQRLQQFFRGHLQAIADDLLAADPTRTRQSAASHERNP